VAARLGRTDTRNRQAVGLHRRMRRSCKEDQLWEVDCKEPVQAVAPKTRQVWVQVRILTRWRWTACALFHLDEEVARAAANSQNASKTAEVFEACWSRKRHQRVRERIERTTDEREERAVMRHDNGVVRDKEPRTGADRRMSRLRAA